LEKIQESDKFNSERKAEEKRREAEAEEKRGLEILKNGDLVKHRDTDEIGVVVEAERRSFIDVPLDGKVCRCDRADAEVINETR